MPATTDYTQYPSMQPCCGNVAMLNSSAIPIITDTPVYAGLFSMGSGTTISNYLDGSLAALTLTNDRQPG